MIRDGTPVLIDFGSCQPFGANLQSLGTDGWYEEEFFTSEAKHDEYSLKKLKGWLQEPEELDMEGFYDPSQPYYGSSMIISTAIPSQTGPLSRKLCRLVGYNRRQTMPTPTVPLYVGIFSIRRDKTTSSPTIQREEIANFRSAPFCMLVIARTWESNRDRSAFTSDHPQTRDPFTAKLAGVNVRLCQSLSDRVLSKHKDDSRG